MKLGIRKGNTLKMVLREMSKNKCAQILQNNIIKSDKIDYIELEGESITFLPTNKQDDKPWQSRFRQKAKIGVVMNKILEATPYEIKSFTDEMKAMVTNSDFECKFLEGDELVWSYTKDNIHWFEKFPMSCMSYDKTRLPGRELYRINPNHIKVAAAIKDNKVYARCLIAWNWKLTGEFYGNKDTLCIANRIYWGSKRAEIALGEFLKTSEVPIYWQYWDRDKRYLNNKEVTKRPSARQELIFNEHYGVVSGDSLYFSNQGDKVIGTC